MLLIIDASGSMGLIRYTLIDQLNETLQTFRDLQETYASSLNIFVSLVTFNSNHIKTMMDTVPAADIKLLKYDEYQPDKFSPLYDAMGSSLSRLRHQLYQQKKNQVVVTVISDGLENDSKEYNNKMITNLVRELKSMGWIIVYIGANQHLKVVEDALTIKYQMGFNTDSEEVVRMMRLYRQSCIRFVEKVSQKLFDDAIDLQNRFFNSE